VRGYLDKIAVDDVGRFEAAFLEDIRANGSDILEAIRVEKDLSPETEKKLTAYFDRFSKTFS
jgi:F-type H+-transporting ATPase subunit alpha